MASLDRILRRDLSLVGFGDGLSRAFTEFFGEEEELRERTRDLVSAVTLVSPNAA